MEYSNSLLFYSDHDFDRSYISDEIATDIRGYMNDNDFFDYLNGPLELPAGNNVWMPMWPPDVCKNKAMEFDPNSNVDYSLEADVREMSYLFPDLIFELTVYNLDYDEYTKFYYQNGKVKTANCKVAVTYPDFNDLEWRDATC